MRAAVKRPIFDRDEYFESSSRVVRWIVLALVLITFPFDSSYGLIVLTVIIFMAVYNALRYLPSFRSLELFKARVNSLGVDHVFVLGLIVLSGGLASPYYPLFYLLIIGTIASYGIAGFAFFAQQPGTYHLNSAQSAAPFGSRQRRSFSLSLSS